MNRRHESRTPGRFRHLGRILPEAVGRAFRRRGFSRARVITDWSSIVGEELARNSQPQKIANGVLTVLVTPGHALILQHLEPVILERIATFCGDTDGSIVTGIKLKQWRIVRPEASRRKSARALTAAETAYLEQVLEGIGDKALREALMRLGRAVMASQPARKTMPD